MSGRGQRALLATSSRQAIAPEAREPPLRRRVGWIAPPPLRVRASYVGYVGAPRYAPGATRLPAPPGSPPPASPLSKAASGFFYSCDCIAVHMSSHEAVDVWCPCNRDDPGPLKRSPPGARGGFSGPPIARLAQGRRRRGCEKPPLSHGRSRPVVEKPRSVKVTSHPRLLPPSALLPPCLDSNRRDLLPSHEVARRKL